ncbi:hypothetical protein [Actinoplanes sp. NPDC049118]|uniref:hypothetical protein n=1 Tax=Actinoplanes sp. NPDC049118 TaxID=3155769 RepID=UPI003408AAE3
MSTSVSNRLPIAARGVDDLDDTLTTPSPVFPAPVDHPVAGHALRSGQTSGKG